jgi:hypothetical protein
MSNLTNLTLKTLFSSPGCSQGELLPSLCVRRPSLRASVRLSVVNFSFKDLATLTLFLFFIFHNLICKIHTLICKFYTLICKIYTLICKIYILTCKIHTLIYISWIGPGPAMSCRYAYLHVMSWKTTMFQEILVNSIRGQSLTKILPANSRTGIASSLKLPNGISWHLVVIMDIICRCA